MIELERTAVVVSAKDSYILVAIFVFVIFSWYLDSRSNKIQPETILRLNSDSFWMTDSTSLFILYYRKY